MLVKVKLITITLVTLQKLTIPLRNSIEQDYNRGFEVQLVYIYLLVLVKSKLEYIVEFFLIILRSF